MSTVLAQLYHVSLRSFLRLVLRFQPLIRDQLVAVLADDADGQRDAAVLPARGRRVRSTRASPKPRPRRRRQSARPPRAPSPCPDSPASASRVSGDVCSTSTCDLEQPRSASVADEAAGPDAPVIARASPLRLVE